MQQLIAYAHERMSKQNAYPFCAYVVKDDQVIAKAYNDVNNSWGDRTTHGEMVALKKSFSSASFDNCDSWGECVYHL